VGLSPAENSVWAYRPFLLFWISRVLSTLCFQVLAVAVAWRLYTLTGNALDLGVVGLVQFAAILLFTLPAGYLADRADRRLVVALCQACVAIVAACLLLGTVSQGLGRTAIFAQMAVIGAARAIEAPNMASLLPGLIPRSLFPRATAWAASATQTAQILGPALGGGLCVFGAEYAFGAAAMLLTGAALAAALIPPQQAMRGVERPGLQGLLSGFVFVGRHRIVLGAISLDLCAVLLGGAVALLPIFAKDILDTGPGGLGLLRASPAIGALATSVWLAQHPLRPPVGRSMFAALILFGAATLLFAWSTQFILSCAALAVVGAADVVSVVIRSSLVQLRTPDEMRGRVSAVNSLCVGASNQLGDFRAGAMAALLGTVPAAILGGLGSIGIALLWMRLFPELRRLEKLDA